MKIQAIDNIVIFGTGALGYGLIECIWRGETHPAMLAAGGVCLLSLGGINRKMRTLPLLYRSIAGSVVITAVELVFGAVFNLGLGMQIWDYSRIPFNYKGQICLLFSVIWALLSIGGFLLEAFLRRCLQRGHGNLSKA